MLKDEEIRAMWTTRALDRLEQAAQEAQQAGLQRSAIMATVYAAITQNEDDE